MGSINSFGQVIQEILLNNYVKTILKTQKLEILSPLSRISRWENLPNKITPFSNLKCKYLEKHL